MTAIAAVAACIIPTYAGVGGGGRELLVLTSVQEMIVQVDGERQATPVLLSVEWTLVTMIFVCSSATFSTNGTSYQNVCGMARGYQKGITPAFYDSTSPLSSINSPYVAGLSITYGNPRQHIWTYATGRYDHLNQHSSETNFICPCANEGGQSGPSSPSYVGMNY